MSDLRVSETPEAFVRRVCDVIRERSRESVSLTDFDMTAIWCELIAQRDHRMRVEGAKLALEDPDASNTAREYAAEEGERIVTEWEASNGSA